MYVKVPETWSPILQEASKLGELKIVPYEVHIGYDLWSYRKKQSKFCAYFCLDEYLN
jgi:hypothetical protein